jgi:hypothetical protein
MAPIGGPSGSEIAHVSPADRAPGGPSSRASPAIMPGRSRRRVPGRSGGLESGRLPTRPGAFHGRAPAGVERRIIAPMFAPRGWGYVACDGQRAEHRDSHRPTEHARPSISPSPPGRRPSQPDPLGRPPQPMSPSRSARQVSPPNGLDASGTDGYDGGLRSPLPRLVTSLLDLLIPLCV